MLLNLNVLWRNTQIEFYVCTDSAQRTGVSRPENCKQHARIEANTRFDGHFTECWTVEAEMKLRALSSAMAACACPFNSSSDLFKKSNDVLAHVRQTHNDVVVVDVAESGMVPALPSGLVQDQIPAVDSGEEILVLSANTQEKRGELPEHKPDPFLTADW